MADILRSVRDACIGVFNSYHVITEIKIADGDVPDGSAGVLASFDNDSVDEEFYATIPVSQLRLKSGTSRTDSAYTLIPTTLIDVIEEYVQVCNHISKLDESYALPLKVTTLLWRIALPCRLMNDTEPGKARLRSLLEHLPGAIATQQTQSHQTDHARQGMSWLIAEQDKLAHGIHVGLAVDLDQPFRDSDRQLSGIRYLK